MPVAVDYDSLAFVGEPGFQSKTLIVVCRIHNTCRRGLSRFDASSVNGAQQCDY